MAIAGLRHFQIMRVRIKGIYGPLLIAGEVKSRRKVRFVKTHLNRVRFDRRHAVSAALEQRLKLSVMSRFEYGNNHNHGD